MAVLRGTGYASIVEPDVPMVERDTITCGHCQRLIFVKPGTVSTVYLIFNKAAWAWEEVGGFFCKVCMRPVCPSCGDQGRCLVWEKRLEASEAKDRLKRSVS